MRHTNLVRIALLVLFSPAAFAQTSPTGQFKLQFDANGITSLKYNGDKYPTDYIADEATLGHVTVHYKMGENDWRQFSTRDPQNKYQRLPDDRSRRVTQQLSIIYNPQSWLKNE
jgi:hypothetical protein